jgi:hypothetical protein
MIRYAFGALSLLLLGTGTSQATLIDRGGGLIYDDVLNVTWMQDAAYSIASGATLDGRQQYAEAMAFAANVLYYDSARDVFWGDWRLPRTVNDFSSATWDLTGQSSELAYMYYINLGFAPGYDANPASPDPVATNYNPFLNMIYRAYWSETLADRPGNAWYHHFHFGFAGVTDVSDRGIAWLLRDGDVGLPTNVPEPGTLVLLGSGLLIGVFARRSKSHAKV